MGENIQVIPLGDLKEHQPDSDCWCHPVECFDGDGVIWVHNSMDRREHTVEKGITQ